MFPSGPSGPGTLSISCSAREQGGEKQEWRKRGKDEEKEMKGRGGRLEEETHTKKERQSE